MNIDMSIERETEYLGTFYRVVEVLNSDMLLVVKKEDYDNKKYPLQTYVIPGE